MEFNLFLKVEFEVHTEHYHQELIFHHIEGPQYFPYLQDLKQGRNHNELVSDVITPLTNYGHSNKIIL